MRFALLKIFLPIKPFYLYRKKRLLCPGIPFFVELKSGCKDVVIFIWSEIRHEISREKPKNRDNRCFATSTCARATFHSSAPLSVWIRSLALQNCTVIQTNIFVSNHHIQIFSFGIDFFGVIFVMVEVFTAFLFTSKLIAELPRNDSFKAFLPS